MVDTKYSLQGQFLNHCLKAQTFFQIFLVGELRKLLHHSKVQSHENLHLMFSQCQHHHQMYGKSLQPHLNQ